MRSRNKVKRQRRLVPKCSLPRHQIRLEWAVLVFKADFDGPKPDQQNWSGGRVCISLGPSERSAEAPPGPQPVPGFDPERGLGGQSRCGFVRLHSFVRA